MRAAAETNALRGGYAPPALRSDRNEHQTLQQPLRAARARVVVELELQPEDRGRAAPARERHGPSPLFLAQYFAQETANAEGDAVVPAQAAAGYPSLGFDQDILLPGEATAFATDGPRVNILV
tara:strand:- start:10045 stop:10413 length:369 start_codon:yes stop_codon:yes gene_type:complete